MGVVGVIILEGELGTMVVVEVGRGQLEVEQIAPASELDGGGLGELGACMEEVVDVVGAEGVVGGGVGEGA